MPAAGRRRRVRSMPSIRPPRPRPGAALPAAALAGALIALPSATAVAAPAGPANLRVTAVTATTPSVAAGATLAVRDTTRNTGRARARASHTRYYLSADVAASLAARRASTADPRGADADVALVGARAVPALRPARAARARRTVRVTVPATVRPGTYRLLACADDRGAVREARETDNCRAGGPVTVSGGTAATGDFTSFNDALAVLPDARIASQLPSLKGLGCTPAVPRRAVKDLRAALRGARAALTVQVGAPAMAAFASSTEARTADAARGAALGALTEGNLGAALVAQLRAAELAPHDRDVLQNTAALATSAGLPNEALALLDAATKADPVTPLASGLDRRAGAAQIRAVALQQLGRAAEARTVLARVPALDPALGAEAASSQAADLLCAGGSDAAVIAKLRRSAKRRATATGEPTPPTAFDESGGRASTLRPFRFPANPRQAAELKPYYDDLAMGRAAAEIDARNQARDEVQARLRDREVGPAQRRRELALRRVISQVHARPEAKALFDAAGREVDEAITISNAFFNPPDGQESRWLELSRAASDACRNVRPNPRPCEIQRMRETCTPEVKAATARIVDHLSRARAYAEQELALQSRIISGLASNFDDPDNRAEQVLLIQSLEHIASLSFIGPLQGWGVHLRRTYDECVESPDGSADPAAATPDAAAGSIEGPEACNAVTKSFNFVLDTSKLIDLPTKLPKIKVNCERIQVAYEFGKSNWAQAFAQVDWKFRAGTVTAFVGVRGKIEIAGREDQLKGGLYITASKDGVEDLGFRVSPGSSVKIGPVVEIQTKADWDLSFVPGFQALGGLVSGV
ncbi:hypothetical protein C7Y72_00475 [Paraconexibacter algicola]|uniref:CARDB domain-containing protein n=2 Tax=Paraconexibacter algicola TaxID=2133960 RepID=A0A2T4UG83_9ACTN|nr:hypothetical protein C7Y72_00475 [Paraconexibacter algicola]